jgi:aspartate 1-decarboxylase
MQLTMMKGKIHRAIITETCLAYEGSITVDPILYDAVGILPYEQVDVLDMQSGARFTTYVIEGRRGSGEIQVNGAAARLVQKGDEVIIIAYARMSEAEAKTHEPKVVLVDAKNNIVR